MDRIQPSEFQGVTQVVEAFVENEECRRYQLKSAALQRDKAAPIVVNITGDPVPQADDLPHECCSHEHSESPSPPQNPRKLQPFPKLPKIYVAGGDAGPSTAIEIQPLNSFENLTNISRFIMNYTGQSTCRICTPSDVLLFKCHFPRNTYWEGCHPDPMEKITEIREYRNSKMAMTLRYSTPPCHSCFEEEINTIDIVGGDDRLMATIVQKKTWIGAKINREVFIEPGPYGKSDEYMAQFTWNDASINFKGSRSGVVVATLMTDCKEKGQESSYVLQFLRDIRPRDKAILIAFMISRDSLLADESQSREVGERVTMFIVIIGFIVICSYFLLPTSRPQLHH